MPAVPLPLVTPWHRAAWQAVVRLLAERASRAAPVPAVDRPPLDGRLLRDIGLADGLVRGSRPMVGHGDALPPEWRR